MNQESTVPAQVRPNPPSAVSRIERSTGPPQVLPRARASRAQRAAGEFSWLLRYPGYYAVYRRYRRFTMIPPYYYLVNLELAQRYSATPGAVVECGTWKGGMIAGMAEVAGASRPYHLFDSFEGLPEPRQIDGTAAANWQAEAAAENFFDNCTASPEDARAAMCRTGASDYRIHRGWFEQTLGGYPRDLPISILRLDGDWYDSTRQCLDALFPRVATGGIVIVDDYCKWDGCTRAVHDYLSANGRSEKVRQRHNLVAYIVKESP